MTSRPVRGVRGGGKGWVGGSVGRCRRSSPTPRLRPGDGGNSEGGSREVHVVLRVEVDVGGQNGGVDAAEGVGDSVLLSREVLNGDVEVGEELVPASESMLWVVNGRLASEEGGK
jgi:hypothetical protein